MISPQTGQFVVNLLSIGGLFLDAVGALFVLGPDVSTIARFGTMYERIQLRQLFDELQAAGRLDESTPRLNLINKLVKESWLSDPGFTIEEVTLEDGRVIYGETGLEDGARSSTDTDQFEDWIAEYTGTDRDFYRTGASLLFLGFLLQIAARILSMNGVLGLLTVILSLGVALYMAYRIRVEVWFLLRRMVR